MSDVRFQEIEMRIRSSFPDCCLLYIDEIENPELEDLYQQRKISIQQIRGSVREEQLFHGTSVDGIRSIGANGFQVKKNKRSAFGKGTYFAKNASYSFSYMKEDNSGVSYMFLCDVLVGNIHTYGSNETINTEIHDNSVNSLQAPSIFVTGYDDGAFPRYVIAFHKYAT